MTRLYNLARGAITASLLAISAHAEAGNIAQYQVSREGNPYSEISGGTAIACRWSSGTTTIFPNGYETPNTHEGDGFPVGFDFRFGGQRFNSFVVSSAGDIYLGKGRVNTADAFSISMSPIKNGLKKGSISYLTAGEEGHRVLTIQYANVVLNEGTTYCGKYSIQFRLHEADGKVEIAFDEIETAYSAATGFGTWLKGWDEKDVLVVTAPGLNSPLSVSTAMKPDMLNVNSYITWDKDDYDKRYQPVLTFKPVTDTTPPSASPQNLTVSQSGAAISISVDKAPGVDATVVLVSEEPMTPADLPVDGETFRGTYQQDGKQVTPTTFGNAKALYYGTDSSISLTLNEIVNGTTYYVKALSANSYPAYGLDNAADASLTTSQAPPRALTAQAIGETGVAVTVKADNRVIVAATTEPTAGYQKGYTGVFGTPAADAATGDELAGGGTVVYAGEPGMFALDCAANSLTFLRAWTVKDGIVSATATDGVALPTASLPYEPDIEHWPYGEQLKFWSATDNQFIPWRRAYKDDAAIYAVSTTDTEVKLTTPVLPLDTYTRLTFEFAMETAREAAETDDSAVAIPQGSEPGQFGDTGYLRITGNDKIYKTITNYSGTMVSAGEGTNEDGSSSYETVEVDLPPFGNSSTISFEFSTPKFSKLYLRNIRIERTGEAPHAPTEAPTELRAEETRDAEIKVACKRGADAINTLVMMSDSPFTEAESPDDGTAYVAGARIGNATVLYYGGDEFVECATDNHTFMPDYDTDYYIRAISASASPLYNLTEVAGLTYRTLADMGCPDNLTANYNGEAIEIEADRSTAATGTIILITTESEFDGDLEDGVEYKTGDTVGNATVIYRGTDNHVVTQTTEFEAGKSVYVTGFSYNSRGWYGNTSMSVKVATTEIESVNADEIDIPKATIYTLSGVRLSVTNAKKLPTGIYIVNGNRVRIR